MAAQCAWLGDRRRHRRCADRRDRTYLEAPQEGCACDRLIEVKPAVSAAEVEQGVELGVEARLHNAPHQDVMVSAIVDCVSLAFEHAERFLKDRRSGLAPRPVVRAEAVFLPGREADRGRLLAGLQHVYREMLRARQRVRAGRLLVNVDQQQRRIERHGGEAVRGQADRAPVRIEAGHDRHARREAAKGIPQGAGVRPGSVFAGSVVGHVFRAYSAPTEILHCAQARSLASRPGRAIGSNSPPALSGSSASLSASALPTPSGFSGTKTTSPRPRLPLNASIVRISDPVSANFASIVSTETPRCSAIRSARSIAIASSAPLFAGSNASIIRSHSLSSPIERLLKFAEPTRMIRSSTMLIFEWT